MPETTESEDTGSFEEAKPPSPRSLTASDTPRRFHDWSDDNFWGDDQNYPDQTDGGVGLVDILFPDTAPLFKLKIGIPSCFELIRRPTTNH